MPVPPPETVARGIDGGGGGTRRWLPIRGADLLGLASAAVFVGLVPATGSVWAGFVPVAATGGAGFVPVAGGCMGFVAPADPALGTKPSLRVDGLEVAGAAGDGVGAGDGAPGLAGLGLGAWAATDPMLATKPAITNSPVSIRL